jgi:PAS domain S-box-containing protein
VNNPGNKTSEDMEVLSQAFQAFNEATGKLQDSYDNLQERVKKLDLELAEKNAALEKNLREKEEVKNYLNYILESLTNGVIVVDRNARITTFNRTAGTLTGLAPADCLGQPIKDIFDNDIFDAAVSRVSNSAGAPLSLERELPGADGQKIHLRISASWVRDRNQKPVGTVIVLQDTTRLKFLEEEAQRNKRLQAMGEMAAGIAHEIRNPLASIELFASLLKKDLEDEPAKDQLVEHIRSGVKNMDRIISSFLLFAKSPRPSRQKCNIQQLLKNLLDHSTDFDIPDNIRIESKFHSEEFMVQGDDELLRRVFLNLIRNGIQAMPQGGVLEVKVEPSSIESDLPDWHQDSRRFVTITVSDTGNGIHAEYMQKIFNPFFSTKDKGTGLGLSICHNIIKAHQGTIDVRSEENEPTAFIVKIPCWDHEFDEE